MCVCVVSFVHKAFPVLASVRLMNDLTFLPKYPPCFVCQSEKSQLLRCRMLVCAHGMSCLNYAPDSWQHVVTVFPLHAQKRSLGGWGKERNAKQFGYPRISELGDDNRDKELTPISKRSSAQRVILFVG